jgi:general secretion pathway protein H
MARGRSRAFDQAFTLIELMAVVALIGLLTAASVVGMGSVYRTKLKSAATRTAGALRVAFDRTTLTGEHIRLAIDLEQGKAWLEGSPHGFSLRKGREQHVTTDANEAAARDERSAKPQKSLFPLGSAGEGADDVAGDDASLLGIDKSFVEAFERDLEPIERPKAYFERIKGPGSIKLQLEGKVRVAAVMTPHLEEPATEGTAYIYFFPQGHAEPAIIHLANSSDDYYSVVLHPLTGKAKVYSCRYRIPKRFGEVDTRVASGGSPCEGS